MRTFVYSGGFLVSKTEPETGTTSFAYSNGLLSFKVDAKGQKTVMVYDANKRVSQIQKYPNGVDEDLCQRVDYYYDSNPFDSTYSLNVAGRVAAMRYWGRMRTPAEFDQGFCGKAISVPGPIRSGFMGESDHRSCGEIDQ